MSPNWHQAIIWTNAGLLFMRPLAINFGEICVQTFWFSYKKMDLKVSSAKWQPFYLDLTVWTHWGRVMHICFGNPTIIDSDNGLSPGRRQAIIWTNAGILLIRPLGTNFSEILIKIHIFSINEMHLKMPSAKRRPFCQGLTVLRRPELPIPCHKISLTSLYYI